MKTQVRPLGVGRGRVREAVVAHERPPHLLTLVDASRVDVRVTEEVVDARELASGKALGAYVRFAGAEYHIPAFACKPGDKMVAQNRCEVW
jgi:hypothetical protein